MKKIMMLYLCVNPSIMLCASPSPHITDMKAQQADSQNDYYSNTIIINGSPVHITSYFNLKENSSALQKVFTTHKQATYDLRPYETDICKRAMSTMPMRKLYRGRIGLFAGILIGASTVIASETYKTTSIEKSTTDN